jgi:hypothetical protein
MRTDIVPFPVYHFTNLQIPAGSFVLCPYCFAFPHSPELPILVKHKIPTVNLTHDNVCAAHNSLRKLADYFLAAKGLPTRVLFEEKGDACFSALGIQ